MSPGARSIAHALADAVKPRVVKAQRYLDEWRGLAVAGVPPHELRHALDRDVHRTPAMDALKAWDGKGCMAMIGALESGKSHAAALWILDGLRRGRRCVWISSSMLLSWTDVEIAMTRGTSADRLAFDDGGVGTISQTAAFGEKFEAVLHARHSKGKPTIFTSNSNRAHVEEIVGARVLSRMKAAGEIVEIGEELDLRAPESEDVDEDTGHGERWRRARRIVDVFGLELDDRFDEETNKVERRTRVGDALDGRNLDAAQLEELAAEYLIPWPDVLARAEELEQATANLAEAWKAADPGDAGRAAKMEEIKRKAAEDLADEGRKRGSPPSPALGEAPRWASKEALRKLGFEVTRKRPGTKAKASTFRVLYRGEIKHAGILDEREGWRIAAGLVDQDTLEPGSCSSPDYYQRTQAIRDAALARRCER